MLVNKKIRISEMFFQKAIDNRPKVWYNNNSKVYILHFSLCISYFL